MDTQAFKTATMQIITEVTQYMQVGRHDPDMEGDIRVLRLLSMSLTAALQNASITPIPEPLPPIQQIMQPPHPAPMQQQPLQAQMIEPSVGRE